VRLTKYWRPKERVPIHLQQHPETTSLPNYCD